MRKHTGSLITLFILTPILFFACARQSIPPSPSPEPSVMRICGATSMYPLMEDIIAAFTRTHSGLDVRLGSHCPKGGLAALLSGEADVGLVARDILGELGSGERLVTALPIGMDAIVVAVNGRNTVQSISLDDLRRLYAGEIHDWAEVAGNAGLVQVVTREEGSDTRRVFEERVLHGLSVTSQAVVLPSSEAVYRYLLANEGAIGYLSQGWLRAGIKALALEGISPTPEAVRSGAYPLNRPLFIVTGPEPSPSVRALLSFILSDAGQQIVAHHHVPLR